MDQLRIIQEGPGAAGKEAAHWAEALADPAWRDRAEVLKEDGEVRVLRVEMLGQMVVIKQWDVSRFKRRVQGLMKGTPAWRHWRGAGRLKMPVYQTARTYVLARGKVNGVLTEILVMEALDGASVLEHLASGTLTVRQEHRLAEAFGRLCCELSIGCLSNRDHKASNVIALKPPPDTRRATEPVESVDWLAIIDCGGVRRGNADWDTELFCALIECIGVGHCPRRSILMRALRSRVERSSDQSIFCPFGSNGEMNAKERRQCIRTSWDSIKRMVQTHGDPTPKINPLSET